MCCIAKVQGGCILGRFVGMRNICPLIHRMVKHGPIPSKASPQCCAKGNHCVHGPNYCGEVVVPLHIASFATCYFRVDGFMLCTRMRELSSVVGMSPSCCSFSFTILLVAFLQWQGNNYFVCLEKNIPLPFVWNMPLCPPASPT